MELKFLKKLAEMEYKKMIMYPLIIFVAALLIIAVKPPTLGIDLAGGVVVTAQGINDSPENIEKYVQDKTGISVRAEGFSSISGEKGVNIYAPVGSSPEEIIKVLEEKYPKARYAQSEVQPTFGKLAQRQGIKAIGYAFLGMAVVVFLFFRILIPSGTIIFSAISDMMIALSLMSLTGIELSQATIAALLMLIGYSVDSNILLTTKMLKRKEKDIEKAYFSAVSTGFTMSTTTLGALFALWAISTAQVIDQIASVLMFGLLADFMNTWVLNAGVLKWYLGRGEKQ